MSKPKIIIIGGGAGGIYASVHLALNNYDVTLYEKNSYLGGRCSSIYETIDEKQYSWDQGASLYLLPRTFDKLFTEVGIDSSKLNLHKCMPNYSIYWNKNESMILSTDLTIMRSEIEKKSSNSSNSSKTTISDLSNQDENQFDNYLKFLSYSYIKSYLSEEWVLRENLGKLSNIIKFNNIKKLFQLDPFSNLYNKVNSIFKKNDKIVQSMTFQTMYMGISPFDSFGTYSLLEATELIDGIYYPAKGMSAIIDLLVERGKELGVKYYTNSTIDNIIIKNKKAIGIKLNETNIYADYIISNADLSWSYNNLITSSDKKLYRIDKYVDKLNQMEYSCSTFNFYWALKRNDPKLKAHNIFLSDKYQDSFDNIFYKGKIPDRISFYVHNPTIMTNDNPAITILVPCPNKKLLLDCDIKQIEINIKKQILDRFVEHDICINESDIIFEKINNPDTWTKEFNLQNGAVLGLNHKLKQMLIFRPKIVSEYIDNLYFTGSSTYPGAGVQICMSSGRLASLEIINSNKPKSIWNNMFSISNIIKLTGIVGIAILIKLLY
jgi:phytoene desaturase (3,4-didehydrolycopene-forming)